MQKSVYFLFAVLFLASCQSLKEGESQFERDGISFVCPANWEVKDEEALEEAGYYLRLANRDPENSSNVTMAWFYDTLELNYFMNDRIIMLRRSFESADIKFEKPGPDNFNKFRCLSSEFSFQLADIPHEGVIDVFHGNEKTIAVFSQQAVSEEQKNQSDFDRFEQSFKSL